ncbi:hypothetical protein Nepgr_003927 [Nepenthes gracilis]|uniref:Uncharacterized protein n=1 Tax=Nepenthes gracilis TaxID=150966 RepID=A0AAD3S0I4_NEPGR|nr:hypothetical protein Nepgr_003927 [Nepenthes gracilis]
MAPVGISSGLELQHVKLKLARCSLIGFVGLCMDGIWWDLMMVGVNAAEVLYMLSVVILTQATMDFVLEGVVHGDGYLGWCNCTSAQSGCDSLL